MFPAVVRHRPTSKRPAARRGWHRLPRYRAGVRRTGKAAPLGDDGGHGGFWHAALGSPWALPAWRSAASCRQRRSARRRARRAPRLRGQRGLGARHHRPAVAARRSPRPALLGDAPRGPLLARHARYPSAQAPRSRVGGRPRRQRPPLAASSPAGRATSRLATPQQPAHGSTGQRVRLRGLAALGAVGLALASAPALRADPPPPSASVGPRPPHSAEQQERLRRRMERLLERAVAPSASASALPAPSASGLPAPSASGAAPLLELARRWAELSATREGRREKHRAELVREMGARLQDPAVRAELALHAQRVAELSRLEFLAKNARSGEQREKLLARIQKLLAREASRHQRSLRQLTPPAPSGVPKP